MRKTFITILLALLSALAASARPGDPQRGYRHEDIASGWDPDEGMWQRPTGRYVSAYDVKPVIRLGLEF